MNRNTGETVLHKAARMGYDVSILFEFEINMAYMAYCGLYDLIRPNWVIYTGEN